MNIAQHIIIHGNVQIYNVSSEHAAALLHETEDHLGEITRMRPEITFNTNRTRKNGRKAPDGIELRFGTARPTEATRQLLRDHGYQFSERQTIWYAIDNEKSRTLADRLANEDVEVDTTQYVKHHFWARVRSTEEYNHLTNYTEFWVKTEPPQNFYSKSKLEVSPVPIQRMINEGRLYFKKFYNRPVEDGEQEPEGATDDQIADRLDALADGMQKEIDSKFNSATSRQNPTHRRNRIVAGMEADGQKLLQVQRVLYALANVHRAGNIELFPLLQQVRTKSQVRLLNLYALGKEQNWQESTLKNIFDDNRDEFERLGIERFLQWAIASEEIKRLLKDYSRPETDQQQQTREMEREVWGRDIPGFFPTPRPLIDRMLQLADIKSGQIILDPSAGKGDILDTVREKFTGAGLSYYAAEINDALIEILLSKGYKVNRGDFLQQNPGNPRFDRILMNPPFERAQDAEHVLHAMKFLTPEGRLVAVVSEGLFFRGNKKEKAFRQLLRDKNAYVSEAIDGAFRNAFNSANVRVRIIAINADGNPFPFDSDDWERPGLDSDDNNSNDTTDSDMSADNETQPDDEATRLLELEAEAELELLRMRVESERRRRGRGMNGLPVNMQKLARLRQKAWALNSKWQVSDFK